jgi:hypothetical protein
MRRIEVQPPDNAKWQRWRKDCEQETQNLAAAIAQGESPTFKQNLYRRKSIKSDFFFNKSAPFYGKCAYCESPISDFQHGDIEHFRPKGGVTDKNDVPIPFHPGYYWLAYDWENLLPSCAICNQPTLIGNQKIGKHNRFPVMGTHAQKPEEIDQEEPLLINPASPQAGDDPEQHLAVDLQTGLMIGLTERGKKCIEIFGLNVRDQLVSERRRACREVTALLIEILTKETGAEAIAELQAIQQGKRSYTLAACQALAQHWSKLAPIFKAP